MGLDKKSAALLSLNPDVAVIPECSEEFPSALLDRGFSAFWVGSNSHKGLGVIFRNEWTIRALPLPGQKWILSIAVDAPTPFTLLAVWACRAGATLTDAPLFRHYQVLN
jgi:hypothetical protein